MSLCTRTSDVVDRANRSGRRRSPPVELVLRAAASLVVVGCNGATEVRPPLDAADTESGADRADVVAEDGDLPNPDVGAQDDGDGVCVPNCAGRECGYDECGDPCGPGCGTGYVCTDVGTCACFGTACEGECCTGPQSCRVGGCCTPECAGRECGGDGCGGACVPGCGAGEACDEATGGCVPIVPTCTAEAGYPVRPGTAEPVCPPYARPFVFFAPHPDDETIAAAGTMRRYLDEGRVVFVELMTQGETANMCSGAAGSGYPWLGDGGSCPWHSGAHDHPLTDAEACAAARVAEFLAATAALGVTGVRVNDYGSRDLAVAEVGERIAFWTAASATGLTLAGPAGPYDLYTPDASPHPDHVAVFDALAASGHPDVMHFLEYYYNAMTGTPGIVLDIEAWCAAKARADIEYRLWDPSSGRFAIAYHSDPTLFDNGVPRPDGSRAPTACFEYLWLPPGP